MRFLRFQSNLLDSVLVERNGETLHSPFGRFGPTYRLDAPARARLMTAARRFDWLTTGAILAVVLVLVPTLKEQDSFAAFAFLMGGSLLLGGVIAALWLGAQGWILRDCPRAAAPPSPEEIRETMEARPPVSDRALVGFLVMWAGFMVLALLVPLETAASLGPTTLGCLGLFGLGLAGTAWQLTRRLDYLARKAGAR
ncbi:hypothetical protein [Prosthecomicrobium sp. N25]|uniref:hypothetical protein n=1 Tax=Prosthecomicrobium sp. N25 TaxID=3129254 RepID=UPI003077CEA9